MPKQRLSHFAELRQRIMLSMLVLLVAMVVVFYFKQALLAALLSPLYSVPNTTQVQATAVGELFFSYLKISAWGGLFVTLPFMFWQLWGFLAPGLYPAEKRVVRPALVAVPLLFYGGGLFAFYGLLPLMLHYLLAFSQPEVLIAPKLADYLTFLATTLFTVGLAFNLPVVLVLCMAAGLVTPAQLAAARRWVIVAVFIIAALVTPPDPFSQTALALPLLALYEVAILLGRRLKPHL